MRLLYANGSFFPEDQPVLRAQDRGFRFGDGVFETIAVYGGMPYQWEFHMRRLRGGLEALRISPPSEDLHAIAMELLARNRVTDGLLRIALSRGVGSHGYMPVPEGAPTLVVETPARPAAPEHPVTLWLSPLEKIALMALPVRYKLAQGVSSTLARMEAQDHDCYDSLLRHGDGHVCETGSANLFWLKDGRLYTPSLACGVLEGSTRHALMALSSWPVEESAFPLDALREAEAVVICNVGLPVVPVAALLPLGWRWDSVALAQQLLQLLHEDVHRHTQRE